jgi:hypothetical protein
MLKTVSSTRRFAALAVVALSLGVAGCKDEDAHEVEVDFMRISAGAQQIMVNSTGAVTGNITINAGVATAVTVQFLDAAMADALTEHADEFQVNVTPAAGVTFTRTGPFSGTLTGTSAGVRSVSFSLLHIEEDHEDFGPFPVNITVAGGLAQR